jgi:enoyl-CoA hydratase
MVAWVAFQLLDYDVGGSVAEITMRRAPVNAVNHALIDEILAAYRQAKADPEVRAIILTSAFDNAFSAGMDLAMIRNGRGLDLRRFLEKLYLAMHDLQYRMGQANHRGADGASSCCGRHAGRLVRRDSGQRVREPRLSRDRRGPHSGHALRPPAAADRALLFGGKPMTAQEAFARGLVNRVVPQAEVKREARAMAREFAEKSPLVMQLARDAFMRTNDFEYRRAIESAVETICNIIETDDAMEGLAAFNEKRKPRW